MKPTARLQLQLVPSRWRQRLSICSAFLFGTAVATLLHDLALLPVAGISAALVALAAGGVAALIFARLAGNQNARHDENLALIFSEAGQIWIGTASGATSAPRIDAPLPELRKMQRYLGLIWLSNSSAKQALIWPDSLSAGQHRQLRVWLGIHARN